MKNIKIYQTECSKYRFESWKWACEHGFCKDDYELVYDRCVDDDITIEDVYHLLNINHPNTMRSPSMSDVITVDRRAFYIDRIGFKDITDIWF